MYVSRGDPTARRMLEPYLQETEGFVEEADDKAFLIQRMSEEKCM